MEKLPPKQRKVKGASREELLKYDKTDLVDKIIQLEAHNSQLKNIINKNFRGDCEDGETVSKKKRPFDFEKCNYQRILLHILYLGWDYQGFTVQEDSTKTIEHHLFAALTKSCLIESRENSQYHRCGRTDKAVSAYGQVISIRIRSTYRKLADREVPELLYCKILNSLLPKEIRAVGWMPIPDDKPEFSARFDCKRRQYKYYFPRSNLNLTAMRRACSLLIGSRDFRHLCKMDVGNGVTEFTRQILNADILPVSGEGDDPTSMYYLLIEGNAFLWHQIRCIMGVLLLVGEGKEEPGVFNELLDIEKYPRKPQYNMALDIPLNLFHCSYDLEEDSWIYDREELGLVIAHLQRDWTIHSVKTTMIRDCLQDLEAKYRRIRNQSETQDAASAGCERDSVTAYTDCLLQGVKPKVYTPLMEREACSSLEERIDYYRKKRKLNNTEQKMET